MTVVAGRGDGDVNELKFAYDRVAGYPREPKLKYMDLYLYDLSSTRRYMYLEPCLTA